MTTAPTDVRAFALAWLRQDPDEVTRAELQHLLDANDDAQLTDRFAQGLEFGTAGLRGVLGAGPNRMNRAVVIRTTAGLCAYVKRQAADAATRGIVIAYDGRRMSREFAEDVAEVCAGAGLRAYLFTEVAPTPLLAYAVTALGCAAGVMVTASHNPPEYNGYKVYWGNGAQIIPPHDAGIAAAIAAVGELVTVPRPILKEARAKHLVLDAPAQLEESYLAAVKGLALHPGEGTDLAIVYTPLHGVGAKLATLALAGAGFANVHVVPEQAKPDGAFPTVSFPNPEEKGAMDLALALAEATKADLVLANDPDADRLAVAARDAHGRYVQLTGNEVGALLGYYVLAEDPKAATAGERIAITSIVSSPLLGAMCRALGVRYDETLTGFKWIANRGLELERETGARFAFGYEEALGYTVGTVARDKDGVSAAAVFAELAGYYRAVHGRGVLEQLEQVYRRFGVYTSSQLNVTLKGADGAARIARIMDAFRAAPPDAIDGVRVETVTDVATGQRAVRGAATEALSLPRSNVIAYGLADGSRVTLRPSGTEPKIKYYFDVREAVAADEPVGRARERATQRLASMQRAFAHEAAARAGA